MNSNSSTNQRTEMDVDCPNDYYTDRLRAAHALYVQGKYAQCHQVIDEALDDSKMPTIHEIRLWILAACAEYDPDDAKALRKEAHKIFDQAWAKWSASADEDTTRQLDDLRWRIYLLEEKQEETGPGIFELDVKHEDEEAERQKAKQEAMREANLNIGKEVEQDENENKAESGIPSQLEANDPASDEDDLVSDEDDHDSIEDDHDSIEDDHDSIEDDSDSDESDPGSNEDVPAATAVIREISWADPQGRLTLKQRRLDMLRPRTWEENARLQRLAQSEHEKRQPRKPSTFPDIGPHLHPMPLVYDPAEERAFDQAVERENARAAAEEALTLTRGRLAELDGRMKRERVEDEVELENGDPSNKHFKMDEATVDDVMETEATFDGRSEIEAMFDEGMDSDVTMQGKM